MGNLTAELLDGADALLSLLGSQNPGQGEGAKAAPAVSDKNAQAQKAAKAPDGELPDPARYIRGGFCSFTLAGVLASQMCIRDRRLSFGNIVAAVVVHEA